MHKSAAKARSFAYELHLIRGEFSHNGSLVDVPLFVRACPSQPQTVPQPLPLCRCMSWRLAVHENLIKGPESQQLYRLEKAMCARRTARAMLDNPIWLPVSFQSSRKTFHELLELAGGVLGIHPAPCRGTHQTCRQMTTCGSGASGSHAPRPR